MSVLAHLAGELLEREAELAVIAELVRRASSGASGGLLVEGAAGVGKTRLLQAAATVARQRPVRLLRARGGELERSFPFGVVGQLFGAAVAALNAEQRTSMLAGAAELALDVVDPRVSAPTRTVGSQEALYARLHGLYWLCAGFAAQQPLVLVVDDAHWADEPSLQWLLFLARRLDDVAVTLILAARPAGAGDWPAPLVLLRDEARVSVIQPQLLSEQATRVLIERQLGVEAEDAFCAACHRATGGNPFFVSELAALLRADGIAPTAAAALQIASLAPDGIVRSVMVRLGRMSHEAVALARCVAVLGAKAEVRHAGALAGLGPAAAAVAADALAAAGLIASGRPLRFVHPVVRSALYCELAAGERAQLHGRAARLLADEHGELDAIAAHLLASDPAGEHWRIDVLLKGADRALARGAPSIAAACLRRALAEPPPRGERGLVLWRLGGVEARLGDPAAAEHARSAIELATEPRRRAELAFELSIGYLVAGRFEEAIGTLERALEQIDERDEELRWRLEAQLISLARLDGRVDLARRHLERIPRDLRGVTPGERVILAELAHAALIAGEHVETVADLVRRALGADRLVTEHSLGAWPVVNAIMVLAHTEQHELALRACDGLIARSQRKGSPIVFAVLSSIRARLHYMGGAIPDAIGDAKAAIGAASEFGQLRLLPDPCATLIDALLEASDIEGAQRALLSAGVGDEIPKSSQFVTLIRRRGRLRLAQGQTEAGIGDLLAACQLLADLGLTSPMTTHLRATTAVALAGEGRRAEAQLLLGDELVAARRFGAHGTLGIALRAAGVIEGGETGVAYLREAVVHLERSTARLEHARALADLGAALRRAGQRREAQQALRQALDLADRCGGKAVGEQGRAELRIMGARPRRARTAGVGALTPSERRVAQLAAQGLSSPHIAQQLFVTVNTVETHLRHAYMKLDIHSREQLPQALAAG